MLAEGLLWNIFSTLAAFNPTIFLFTRHLSTSTIGLCFFEVNNLLIAGGKVGTNPATTDETGKKICRISLKFSRNFKKYNKQ
jgi:hypothetical protein